MNRLLQVAEVLAYTVENQVHTFVEPVLELCAALLATYAPPPGAALTPLGDSARQGAWPFQGFAAPGCRPSVTAPHPCHSGRQLLHACVHWSMVCWKMHSWPVKHGGWRRRGLQQPDSRIFSLSSRYCIVEGYCSVPPAGSAAVAAALAPQLFPLLQLAGCEEAAAATLAAGCVAALTRLLPNDVGGIFIVLIPAAAAMHCRA